MQSRKKIGFTLVELAIVLVVIGLLIGGLLAASSMVSSAKLNKFTRTITQYDVVTTNFKYKYQDLPGDTDKMAPPGNDDGSVFGYAWCFGSPGSMGWDQCNEFVSFFLHLQSTGGLSNTNYIAYDGPAEFDGDFEGHVPKLDYGANCYLGPFTFLTTWNSADGANFGNGWQIMGGHPTGTTGCMTSIEALAIDTKLDDGAPGYGNVRLSYTYTGPKVVAIGGSDGGCAANSANSYDINGAWYNNAPDASNNAKRLECQLVIKSNWN